MKNQPLDTISMSMTRVEAEILAEVLRTALYLAEENKFNGIDFEDILHFSMYLDSTLNDE
jgi:hypothetical protein